MKKGGTRNIRTKGAPPVHRAEVNKHKALAIQSSTGEVHLNCICVYEEGTGDGAVL